MNARDEPLAKTAANGRGRIRVGIGEFAVATEGTDLRTVGLGSCVGVALYDDREGVAGLGHIMLPSANGDEPMNDGKYADTGIERLVEAMEAHGADREHVTARIAGGSNILHLSGENGNIGTRNVEAVRETLDRLRIPIVDEDVGGSRGRSITFDAETGELACRETGSDSF